MTQTHNLTYQFVNPKQSICQSTGILFSHISNISMLYNLILLSIKKKTNAKITNRTVSNPEENSLFLDLKPYAFLLKAVASALSVPLVTNLRQKEGVDSGAVQQGEPFPCLLCLSSSR